MRIATLNTGSSSIKIAAYEAEAGGSPSEPLLRVNLSGLPGAPHISAKAHEPEIAGRFAEAADVTELALDTLAPRLLGAVEAAIGGPVAAIGHRMVQGGADIKDSREATPGLLTYLETLTPMAPDHQPHNLAAVRALAARRPGLVQTLSFDTAFHRSQPRLAQLYAIPRALTEAGMIRYGYHGLSYAHIARRLPGLFPDRAHRRTLALHLGSGASLCAMLDGRSVACSMGFSANSGIGMATRSGDLDPGAILYLLSERRMSAEAVSHILRQQSGLLGVSGVSGDLRALEASDRAEAKEAIALYIYRIVRECGSMIAAMGGLDALVFTAGIGENSPTVRAGVAEGLRWAGVKMDAASNNAGAADLAAPGSAVGIAVLAADEEWEIASDCLSILGSTAKNDTF